MLYLVGIIITFFLAIILAAKKGKTGADRILVAWLIAIGVHLLLFYFFLTKENLKVPELLGLELPFPFLHGPFLYWYTGAVTGQGKARGWLHFLTFLLAYLLFTRFFLLSAEEKLLIYKAKGKGFETESSINYWLIVVSGVVYFILSLRLLRRYQKILRDQFSHTNKISLSWLRYLIYGTGLIWLAVIFGNSVSIYSLVVAFVVFIGYFGINQVGIFTQQLPVAEGPVSEAPLPNPGVSEAEPKKAKYLKSSLNAASAETIHDTLTRLMKEEKPYTNPELTLAELALAAGVHPNNLSQVINSHEQKTFYDYINSQRVEEFKRIVSLPEKQKFTLLGIAQECGFNSKTSFNRNFKNATGLSPSEYLKQAEIRLE